MGVTIVRDRMRRILTLVLIGGAVVGCAAGAPPPGSGEAAAGRSVAGANADELYVVDCLLPAQIRRLGRAMTFLGPRRAIKTAGRDCAIRGGEYVSYDRADYRTALRVWLPLAEEGDPVAQSYVGEIYEKGLGIEPDYPLAAVWYRKAAERGDARAQVNLGHLYEKGLGVDRDPAKALAWYRRAAGLGEAIVLDGGGLAPEVGQELRALRAEVDRRRGESAALQAQLEGAQRQLGAVERQLGVARQDLERRSMEAEAERRRVEEMAGRLEQLRREARAASSRDDTRIQTLAEQLARRQADLDGQRQEVARLQQRVATLEGETEQSRRGLSALRDRPRDEGVVLPGPTIEMVEPSIVATRGVPVVQVSFDGEPVERVVVGRVSAPAGLMLLTVNDHDQRVDDQGLFRAKIPVRPPGVAVRVVAVDRQGKRSDVEFRLGLEGKPAPADAPQLPPALREGQYYALIIGNKTYTHWPSLKTSESDARSTAEILERRYGFKTRLLVNARRVEILQALNELRNELTEKDKLLVYYAGHGYLDERINRAYWIPVDGQLDSNVEWISTVAITDLVGAISARHVLVVVDSCYSGALTRSALARLEAGMSDEARRHWLELVASKRARTVLSSGELKPVLDIGGGEHSVFARAWLDVLGKNEEVLEGQRLHREIAARVSYAADALKFEQVPQYAPIRFAGHEAGDFLFVPVVK